MNKLTLIFILNLATLILTAQTYPFLDTRLSENERLLNLISLMTIDEKLNSLSTRIAIPRLGIKSVLERTLF